MTDCSLSPPADGPSCRRGLQCLTGPLAAGVVLAAFWVLMLLSLRDKSLTFDETGHAAAGYACWMLNDYRLLPENGNLSKRLCALPLILGHYRFPTIDRGKLWQPTDTEAAGYDWFNKLGNDTAGMLLRGRMTMGLLAVALGALVWRWSGQIFGPRGGLLSLLLYVLNPTILANGALMTSDMACALFFLASAWSFWAMLHRLSPARVLTSAFLMAGLFVSKTSAFLIVPVALTLMAARLAAGQPLPVAVGAGYELARRGRQALAFGAACFVHGVIVVIVIWGFYGFRYAACAPGQSGQDRQTHSLPWETVLDQPAPDLLLARLHLDLAQQVRATRILKEGGVPPDSGLSEALPALQIIRQTVLSPAQARTLDALMSAPPPALVARILEFINRHELLPEGYVCGYAYVWRASQQRPSFFNGEFSFYGWKEFFPYTFLVKTPLPVFAVIVLALAAVAARWRMAKKRVVTHFAFSVVGGALVAPRCEASSQPTMWPNCVTTKKRPAWPVLPLAGLARSETLPLWVLSAFYWAAAVMSHLNIGHRHLLPVYAPLFVLCGAAAFWLDGWRPHGAGTGGRWGRAAGAALVVLVVLLAAEVLYRFPNYLAYFNGIVRPADAYRHLVDSSLDWGQDLPGVKRHIEQHRPAGPVYLAYFGNASPACEQIPARCVYAHPRWNLLDSPPLRRLELPSDQGRPGLAARLRQFPDYDVLGVSRDGRNSSWLLLRRPSALRLTGGTYFISATLLQPVYLAKAWGKWNGHYEADYQKLRQAVQPLLGDDADARLAALRRHPPAEWPQLLGDFEEFRFARLAAFLRRREPDDNVNFSILIYRLTDADLARALDGPPPELDAAAEMKRYEEAVRFEPGSADAHSNLGVALAQANRLPEAIHHYEEALRLTPDDAVIHYNLGNALWQTGRASEAVSHYEEALRLKPDLAGVNNNLAGVLSGLGRRQEAVAHYEQELQIDPNHAEARSNLARLRAFPRTAPQN